MWLLAPVLVSSYRLHVCQFVYACLYVFSSCVSVCVCVFVCVQLWCFITDMILFSTHIQDEDVKQYIKLAKHNLTLLPTNVQK